MSRHLKVLLFTLLLSFCFFSWRTPVFALYDWIPNSFIPYMRDYLTSEEMRRLVFIWKELNIIEKEIKEILRYPWQKLTPTEEENLRVLLRNRDRLEELLKKIMAKAQDLGRKAEAAKALAEKAATRTAPSPAPKTGILRFVRGWLWSLPLGTVTGPEKELNLDLKRAELKRAIDKGMKEIPQLIRERDELARIDPNDPRVRELNQQLREALARQSSLLKEQRELRGL